MAFKEYARSSQSRCEPMVGNSEITQKLGLRKVASDGRKLIDLERKSPESGYMK